MIQLNEKSKKLWKLFTSTLFLSAFTFGGGYVIVTLMKKKFVDEYHWIDEEEMLDLVAIAQSSPGAMAVNGAIVVGYKIAGMIGVIISVIATILPPFISITIISYFYSIFQSNQIVKLLLEGMQVGVGAVIAAVVYDMAKDMIKTKEIVLISGMLISFIVGYFFKINVIFIIVFFIVAGSMKAFFKARRRN